jgi:RNA recognition motif-containing protein
LPEFAQSGHVSDYV